MNNSFDSYAKVYDGHFTNTSIGILQRKRVWKQLNKILISNKQLNILEINCGTGEDAIYMVKAGHNVTATDISLEMIDVAKEKAQKLQLVSTPLFLQSSFDDILKTCKGNKYDMIFSNFGGINCISKQDLIKLNDDLYNLLKPGAYCIMVIMGNACLWENIYFLFKGKWKSAFRRKNERGIDARIVDGVVKTWYYSPIFIKKLFHNQYKHLFTRPIGLFIPPSYLQPFFGKKKLLLSFLNFLENIFGKIALFSNFADHYLICFSRKENK